MDQIHSHNADQITPEKQKKKRKKRQKRKGKTGLVILLTTLCLGLLTSTIYLAIKNKALKNETVTAMAVVEETKSNTYTEAEMESLMKSALSITEQEAVTEGKTLVLSTVREMMEEGEGVGVMLRLLFPDEIVVASDGRYHFFPILDSLKHHAYDVNRFVVGEDTVIHYDNGEGVTSTKGIDVSKFQQKIDWKKVAADDVKYAFIRVGNRGSTEGKIVLDDTYKENIAGAIKNKIAVGVYFFTQAVNKEEAIEEAQFVLENIRPYDVTYPIVIDIEAVTTKNARTENMTKQQWTDVCIAFCEEIKKAGYTPMIYGNLKTFMLMVDMEQLEEYEKWFAFYNTPFYFPYEFSIWQYSSTGKVDGIQGDVDMNVSMKEW